MRDEPILAPGRSQSGPTGRAVGESFPVGDGRSTVDGVSTARLPTSVRTPRECATLPRSKGPTHAEPTRPVPPGRDRPGQPVRPGAGRARAEVPDGPAREVLGLERLPDPDPAGPA